MHSLKVYHDISEFNVHKPVITMGMFDGIHLGHRMLLKRVSEIATQTNGESVVVTFWPHPRLVLNPDISYLFYLTTLEEKLKLLEDAGIQHVVVLRFTQEFANQTACEFTEQFLVKKLNISYLIAGFNHHFGKDRKGTLEDLRKCAEQYNFGIEKLDAFYKDGVEISSTLTRELIEQGKVLDANKILGYDYFIFGTVISGNRIGRSIGFPTANIQIEDDHKLTPGIGVYAVEVKFNGDTYFGMLNIGYRPTIEETTKTKNIEVHILDFEGDIYGQHVTIVLKKKIRDERKFEDIASLKNQLEADKSTIIAFFQSNDVL